MSEYIPSPRDWVREQVELYESSGGKEGTTLRETGLPVIIVTNTGNKTGALRKTPLMKAVAAVPVNRLSTINERGWRHGSFLHVWKEMATLRSLFVLLGIGLTEAAP